MIIGLTGRIAAGKETLTQFLRDKGFVYLESSKPLKDELSKRGMEITRANMQDLGDEFRGKHGAGAILKLLLEIADKDKTKNYVFDSLRNAGEADFLRENVKDFFLIGVDAPQRLRFERIISRGKPSDPKTWEEFLEVDNRDFFDEKNPLGQQVGKVMEKADFIIMNDGDLESSMKRTEEIWEAIENKISKKERVSIFIDGSNLYHSLKKLNISRIDFQKLINILVNNRDLVSIKYYNASLDICVDKDKYWKQQRFFGELRKIPFFEVILCKTRKIRKFNKIIDYEVKGDDVCLAVDLISGAYENLYDTAILVSGDEDFVPAIEKVQRLRKNVENAYFISSSSSALKNISNNSICINKFIKN